MLEQVAFAGVTLALALGAASILPKGHLAAGAVAAIALGVWYLGPQVFGKDWFHHGFWAGVVLGDIMGHAMDRSD